ncbi:MAG: alcohol dehydrogenase catalytic domain-containing protein [Desulfobacterales bacterium]
MKAIVFYGHHDLRVEETPDPVLLADTDIVLRVEKTAICGSDLHLWNADIALEQGWVVGHEFLGTAAEVGSAVQSIKKGDRVFASCTVGCGTCPSCRRGFYSGCSVTTNNLTMSNIFGFSPFLPGGQAEAVRVPFADANCFHMPDALDAEACLFLTDILPTGYMGAELAAVSPGDRIVVFGCGPVGTFAQRSAQLRGASQVIAVDLDAGRLERARQWGCETIDASSEDVLEKVREITQGNLADAAIEAVGLPDLVNRAAEVTRPGGTVAVVGIIGVPFELTWQTFRDRNISLRTGLVNPQVYVSQLLPLIEQGRLDPTEIISHRLSLDEGLTGYDIFANHKENVLKVVLTP